MENEQRLPANRGQREKGEEKGQKVGAFTRAKDETPSSAASFPFYKTLRGWHRLAYPSNPSAHHPSLPSMHVKTRVNRSYDCVAVLRLRTFSLSSPLRLTPIPPFAGLVELIAAVYAANIFSPPGKPGPRRARIQFDGGAQSPFSTRDSVRELCRRQRNSRNVQKKVFEAVDSNREEERFNRL